MDGIRAFIQIILLMVLLSFSSCSRVTDLTPEGRGEVVAFCILTEEATQSLTLDLTDIASPEDRASLSEAVVTLYDNTTGTEAGFFVKSDGNEWLLKYAAIPEHRYLLIITIPGREEITAATTMPPVSRVVFSFGPGYYGTSYELDSLPEGALWVMAMNYDAGTGHKAADKISTSLTMADPFNVTDGVFHASDFFEEVIQYAENGDYFYPYVEGQPLYDKMFRIPPVRELKRESKEGLGWFSVAGYFRTNYHPYQYGNPPGRLLERDGYVLLISASEEYDRSLCEVISKRMQQQAVGDYASLFFRENVYSNIVNGIGIFGAKTEQKLPWNDKPVIFY